MALSMCRSTQAPSIYRMDGVEITVVHMHVHSSILNGLWYSNYIVQALSEGARAAAGSEVGCCRTPVEEDSAASPICRVPDHVRAFEPSSLRGFEAFQILDTMTSLCQGGDSQPQFELTEKSRSGRRVASKSEKVGSDRIH